MEKLQQLLDKVKISEFKSQGIEKFDWSVYLKREKRYLQYVRMADKEKIQNMLEMLFTDIEILCSYDRSLVKSISSMFCIFSLSAIRTYRR